MPIYAYKCSYCGVSKDILRKISDPALTLCPACGNDALEKQVTAAGFQLKGSGWYVTDFREGQKPASTAIAPQIPTDKASEVASPASADSSGAAASAPAPTPVASPSPSTSTSGAST